MTDNPGQNPTPPVSGNLTPTLIAMKELQQSDMGRVVSARRTHTTQRVSGIEILTTDLGLL